MTPTRKTTKTKTPEQRKADREAILDTLHTKIDTLTSSEDWAAYLRFAASFRKYSFNNQMLIQVQCPNATHVAGFRKWQSLGRQVRKGEKAIKILGFFQKKVIDTDPITQEDKERKVVWFPVLSVFDISQTDGEAVPDMGFKLPQGSGEHFAEIEARIVAFLATQKYAVRDGDSGHALAYTDADKHEIVLGSKLDSPAARVAALLHETGHAVLHSELPGGEYHAHRGIYETEAESVHYVLANMLGVPADEQSIPYVAGWAKADRKLIESTAKNVMQAVNIIAQGLGLDDAAEEEEEVAA